MRPDLSDILSGVQRLLQNDVVPALTASPFLAEQTMYATLLLEYCKRTWPGAHLALAEEHGDLRATLQTVAEQLMREPTAATLASALREEIAQSTADVASTALDMLARRNGSLRAAVGKVVELLDANSQRAAAAGSALHGARATIDAYLLRHAARQQHQLELLGLSW